MIPISILFYSLPIDGPLRVTSYFGPRDTGIDGATTYHKGIDLGRDFEKSQTNILSVAKGKVKTNKWNRYRGWYIVIAHLGFETLYQHLAKKSDLAVGTAVAAGTVLGVMGNSSDTSVLTVSLHLHFELHIDGECVDPINYLKNIQEEDMTEVETQKMINEALAGSKDVPSKWSKDGVEWAVGKGYLADSKDLDGVITKEELAAVLYRILGKEA